MDKVPNQWGTGRFHLLKTRRNIRILNASTIDSHRIEKLRLYLRSFFTLPVKISSPFARPNPKYLRDEKTGQKFHLNTHDESVEYESLLKVALQYIQKRDYTVLMIVDYPLVEQNGDRFDPILGRALNQRTCVAQVQYRDLDFFATCAHEIMHNIGVDHTTNAKCLMNPCGSDIPLLADHNLKKLQHFLGFGNDKKFKRSRYADLCRMWWKIFDRSDVVALRAFREIELRMS